MHNIAISHTTASLWVRSLRRFSWFVALAGVAAALNLPAQDQTVAGNLTVTGTSDLHGNSLMIGAQGTSPGLSLNYADADADTLTFYLNRNPASWLWAHSASLAAMRLTGNHELVLYAANGTTPGLTLTPATSTISLGSATLYRDSSGALRTNSDFMVDGTFTASTIASSSGLALNAGGTDQNVTLTPSGVGYTQINGNVGIGIVPSYAKLDVGGFVNVDAASGYKQAGQTILATDNNFNTFVGRQAGNTSNTAGYNIAIGWGALTSFTSGGRSNLAIGYMALNANTTGRSNTALGSLALGLNTTGKNNTALGAYALGSTTTGNGNTAVGNSAGFDVTTGQNNFFLGSSAGVGLTTGSSNIVIGSFADVPSGTDSYQMSIGNLIYGFGVDGAGFTVSSGRIGIGTSTPATTERLEVNGNTTIDGKLTATTGGRFDGPVRIAPQGDLSMGSFTSEP